MMGRFSILFTVSVLLFTFSGFGQFSQDQIIPSASAATENMFVSADNPLFDNNFAGPMVIEVIINDPAISSTTTPIPVENLPDVTVNGQDLMMVQATDGNWYAYFADRLMATTADSFSNINGTSLDFGSGCTPQGFGGNISYLDTDGVYFPGAVVGGGTPGVLGTCTSLPSPNDSMNVIRENKTATRPNGAGVLHGQVGVAENEFPMIQLFDFNVDGNVEVRYNKLGGVQQITLVYLDDADSYASLTTDRTSYPQGSSIHLTITDLQLNIDPTDEDSWTFATNTTLIPGIANGTETFYQVFDENGNNAVENLVPGSIPPIDVSLLNFDDNGVFVIVPDSIDVGTNVLGLRDNDDQNVTGTTYETVEFAGTHQAGGVLAASSGPITFVETQGNSGIFKNTDEGDLSNAFVPNDAWRGTTATVDYNDEPTTILVQNFFGTINIDETVLGGEWNSGEEAPVLLVDNDANLNSLVDEDLDVFDPNALLIPVLTIGTPFTLDSLNNVELSGVSLTIDDVQLFSKRAMITTPSAIPSQSGDVLALTLSDTFADLYNSINDPDTAFNGTNIFNYDIRSIDNALGNSINSFSVDITDGTNTSRLGDNIGDLQGFFDISGATGDDVFSMNTAAPVQLVFTLDLNSSPLISSNTTMPIVVDFFSFGIINDGALPGERINNVIVRVEMEETGDNTGNFEGVLSFFMLNQLNILDSIEIQNLLNPIDDEVVFPIHQAMLDEDSLRITYFDKDATGVFTQVSDQEEAPSHSGTVFFDSNLYAAGEQVGVTLQDADLNLSPEFFDVYVPVLSSLHPSDPARDTVGEDGLGLYVSQPFGEFGRLLDITFDGKRWTSGLTENGGACGAAGTPDDGLGAAGFTLVETEADSGIFVGDFDVPQTICDPDTGTIIPINGQTMTVNYVDYTNGISQIVEVSDSAIIDPLSGLVITAQPTSGVAPLFVQFTSQVTGGALPFTYSWDFDGDGIEDSTQQNPSFVYNTVGTFVASLTVTDNNDVMLSDSITIFVSTPPVVGDILVVDNLAGTDNLGSLFKVDPTTGSRIILSDFGNLAQGTLGHQPTDVAANSVDEIYVVDPGNIVEQHGLLFAINDTSGLRTVLSNFSNPAQGPTAFIPKGIDVNSTGGIFVIDDAPGLLFEINPFSGFRNVISDFSDPSLGETGVGTNDVAVSTSGEIYVVDSAAGTNFKGVLFQVDPITGQRTVLSDFGNATQGPLGDNPLNVETDSSGNILVVDDVGLRGTLFSVDPITGFRTILSDFNDVSEGPLGDKPWGVALESSGDILVIDAHVGPLFNGELFRIDPTTGTRTSLSDFNDLTQGPLGSFPTGVDVIPIGATIITGIFDGNLKVGPGEFVIIDGATVNGNVRNNGGTITMINGCTINGNVISKNGGILSIDSCQVNGKINANTGTLSVTQSTVTGKVISQNQDSVTLSNNPSTFEQNVSIKGCVDAVVKGNKILQNLVAKECSNVKLNDNSIGNNLKSVSNDRSSIYQNIVNGSLSAHNSNSTIIQFNNVTGNMVSNNGSLLISSDNFVFSNLNVKNMDIVSMSWNVVSENLRVKDSSSVSIFNNYVTRNLNSVGNTESDVVSNTALNNISVRDSNGIVEENIVTGNLRIQNTDNTEVSENQVSGSIQVLRNFDVEVQENTGGDKLLVRQNAGVIVTENHVANLINIIKNTACQHFGNTVDEGGKIKIKDCEEIP